MLKFLKNNKLVIGLSAMIVCLAASVVVSTLGWFTASQVTDLRIDSGVISSYFEDIGGSDGSEAHPWVIARPVQLFNLMYLQQSNKMVKDPDNPTGDDVKYCNAHYWYQFGKEVSSGVYKFVDYGDDGVIAAGYGSAETYSPYLNMTYYSNEKALIPIGSEAYPFIGHIVGNNLTVKNMTIYSNHQSDVGVFGYVAEGATVENAYFDNVTINIQGFNSPRESNVGTHPVHADSGSKDTYICAGYIAGHVYDADASFTDVYINNCKMDNEPLATGIKNNFGYFGKVDMNSATPVGSDKHYSLHPNDVHTYFEGKYSGVSNMNLAARKTEYAGSGGSITGNPSVGSAIKKGTYTEDDVQHNSYKFTNSSEGTFNKNVSLATSGYSTNEEELYDAIYYKDGADHQLDPATTILDYIPEDPDSLEDGTYLYYDSEDDDPCWTYLIVTSSEGEITTINFNCYTISYDISNTTYYLKYDNGSVVGTTTAPDIEQQETYADYFFAFKNTATTKGVTSISDAAASEEYKIFIPNHDCYVNATASGTTSSLTTVSSFSSAMGFKVRGNSTEIFCAETGKDSYKLWCSGSNVILRNCVAGVIAQTFDIHGSDTQHETTYTSTYDAVTSTSSLAVGDTISFVYNDNGHYYMIGSQAKNNRNGVEVTVSNNHISDVTGLAISNFTLGQTSNGYTFKDEDTNQYLYAAGTKTSGSNYLRSQDTITSNGYAEWDSISFSGTTATIHNYGNDKVEYLNYHTGASNEGTYHIFRCSHSSAGSPMIFKRSKTSGGTITYEKSFIYSATSQSSGVKSHSLCATYYDEVGGTSFTDLIDSPTAQFNVMASQVTLRASGGAYELVTDVSDLHAGDTLIIASNTQGATAGDITRQYLARIVTEFTNDKSGVVTLGTGTVEFTLGGSNGSWTLENSNSQLLGATAVKELAWGSGTTTWSISIDESNNATIQNGTDSYGAIQYNAQSGSERFTTYTSSQTSIQLYKRSGAVTAKPFYFGDQIGGGYNPDYIDTVGSVTYKADSAQYANSSSNYSAITASSSLTLGSNFYATQYCGNSVVIYVENNKSRDLGYITFSYTATSSATANITKGGGSGETFVQAGCTDLDPTGGETYRLSLSAANIDSLAYCGLDSTGKIYSKYNAEGQPTVSSGAYDYYDVETFVIVISTAGTIDITDIEYQFTSLPGNTGNFGEVGYRSAHYNSNGVFDGNNPQHTLDGTIVNFYYEIAAQTRASIAVSFDCDTSLYSVTLLSTKNFDVYIFNYDIMVYSVKANNKLMTSSSETYSVPITQYDPETGWQV